MDQPAELVSGPEHFTISDLVALSDLVDATWTAEADRDWSVRAGTLEWTCLATADHAVDCVYAPAFFLASRKVDAYPHAGSNLELGTTATPRLLVESLQIATRILAAVVRDTAPDVRAVIFGAPRPLIGAPFDFVPRAGLELILHAHDVSAGLHADFEPPVDLCHRLREHTRPWPVWTFFGRALADTDDPWGDLLVSSGRERTRN